MKVYIVALECIKTKGETEEEPYLSIYVGDNLVMALGPFAMRRGDTQWINRDVDGSIIRIRLSEEDKFKDERYGAVELIGVGEEVDNADRDEHGRYVVNLPPHGTTRYKLYFDTRPDDGRFRNAHYCLQLVSLLCGDAQQSADHVFIKVNGETVWGPQRMTTGNTLSLDSVESIEIHDVTSIQLWEEDKYRNDFFGELRLQIGDNFRFGNILPHTFSRNRGIMGDARYTLRYIVRGRPFDTITGWGRC